MQKPSRLEQSRRRVRLTRLAVGWGSAVAFAAFGLVARAAHPGGAHAVTSPDAAVTSSAESSSDESDDSTTFFGDGSIASSSSDSATSSQTPVRADHEQRLMTRIGTFRAMGCEVTVQGGDIAAAQALFADRDARFSRFVAGSEVNRVNERPFGADLLSADLAAMLEVVARRRP